MKLMYDLSAEDKNAYLAAGEADTGEKIMYCLPYNYENNGYVSGKTIITDRAIYRICNGELRAKFDLEKMTDFNTEPMLGSSTFVAKVDGISNVICRFMSGRHLARYTLMIRACTLLADAKREKRDPGKPLENKEPEHFCSKCGRPFIDNTHSCPFCRNTATAISRLWNMTKGMRLMLAFPLFASVISLIIQFIVPLLQKDAINNYISPAEGVEPGPIVGFIVVVAGIVGTDLLQRLLSVIQTRTSGISSNRFLHILRTVLFEKIHNLSLASIQRKSAGDLMSRLTSDVSVIQGFMTSTMPSVVVQAVSLVVAAVLLLVMNPLFCLFVVAPLPIIYVLFLMYRSHNMYLSCKSWKRNYRLQCLVQDTISGERIVKAFGREDNEIKHFEKAVDDVKEHNIMAARHNQLFYNSLSFLLKIGSYFILLYGNLHVFRGTMSLGELYQYTAYTSILYAPMMTFVNLSSSIVTILYSTRKVFELIDEESEVVDIELPIDIAIEGDIDIKDITFGYNSFDPVIKNVDFSIHQGEMIGLVGASGSGKSTLINLIMRMYDVDEGAIEIDNVNIKDISQKALRSQIGVVLQETYLFHGTIMDNIKYAKPYATDEEVIAAAKLANAHDFICDLPHGYNTMVGERGHSLSGGERQRIAIARAMIHNPRILILDEATAALDTETEKMIQDALNKLMRGRTTIAIAHRLSTLRNADRLVVLDRGRLAEIGTHSELLKKKGIYYRLVMAQRLSAVK